MCAKKPRESFGRSRSPLGALSATRPESEPPVRWRSGGPNLSFPPRRTPSGRREGTKNVPQPSSHPGGLFSRPRRSSLCLRPWQRPGRACPTAWAVVLFPDCGRASCFAALRVRHRQPGTASGVIPDEGEFDRRYAQTPFSPMSTSSPASSIGFSPHFRSLVGSEIAIWSCIGGWVASWCPTGIVSACSASVFALLLSSAGSSRPAPRWCSGSAFVTALVLAYRFIRLPMTRASSALDDQGLRYRSRGEDDPGWMGSSEGFEPSSTKSLLQASPSGLSWTTARHCGRDGLLRRPT